MNKTNIEWCDYTVNPIRARNVETGSVGHFCEKISPGCGHCYSDAFNERVRPSPKPGGLAIGTGLAFIPQNRPKVEMFLDEKKLAEVIRLKRPSRIFWCDMTDLFGEWVPDEWIDRCFAEMAMTPQHTHQILTKRADRMRAYCAGLAALPRSERGLRFVRSMYADHPAGPVVLGALARGEQQTRGFDWPLPNVWLGVSVEDQGHADERIPLLLQTPTAVRFVSYEPALGPIDFLRQMAWWLGPPTQKHGMHEGLDLVIVGGESGSNARPFEIEWARSVVRQCREADTAVFVKQLGAVPVIRRVASTTFGPDVLAEQRSIDREWPDGTMFGNPTGNPDLQGRVVHLKDRKGGEMEEWPKDLRVRRFPGIKITYADGRRGE